MQLPKDAVLLRIFAGEQQKYGHQPLYEAVVMKAREMHMAGATVLRGPLGYGHSSRIHTGKILRLSEDLPVIIELVDERKVLEDFLDLIEPALKEGLVTFEKMHIRMYRAGRQDR